MPNLFNPEELYTTPAAAKRGKVTPRSFRNWRAKDQIPKPDVFIGGHRPAWFGATLNSAPAFRRTKAA